MPTSTPQTTDRQRRQSRGDGFLRASGHVHEQVRRYAFLEHRHIKSVTDEGMLFFLKVKAKLAARKAARLTA